MNAKHAPAAGQELRRALAQFATGVTVVTARAPDGAPVGMTANSFASVSLEPPLVLWSIARSAASFEGFTRSNRYRVHVLRADQLELARRFATRGADKFGAGRWAHPEGAPPQLLDCVAWFDCTHRSQHDEGDHVILVGRVTAYGAHGGAPLIFHDSRYVTDLSEAPLPRALLAAPWR